MDKDFEELVKTTISKNLKDNYIKNIMIGYEVAIQMLKDYIQTHTLKECQEFCDKCLSKENLKLLENYILKEKE